MNKFFLIKTDPSNGTASINSTVLTFNPTTDYSGSDILILTVSDGSYTIDLTINMTINKTYAESFSISNTKLTTLDEATVTLVFNHIVENFDSTEHILSLIHI